MQKEVSILKIMVALKFLSINKSNFKATIFTLFIFGLFSNFAFSQLALQNFNTGIPSTWSINSNQTVANNWIATSATGGYQGTAGVSVNPALNNSVGTNAQYFLIT